jgi:hypothetical protein
MAGRGSMRGPGTRPAVRREEDSREPVRAPAASRTITCGLLVHKAVDNRHDVRTTDPILWTSCGQEKTLLRLLRDSRKGRRNTFTVGNGHHPGETPERGKGRETGVCRGYLALAGWRAALGRPGNRPAWSGVARQGPLHLIHEGGLVVFCRTAEFHAGPTRRPDKRQLRRGRGLPGPGRSVARSRCRSVWFGLWGRML